MTAKLLIRLPDQYPVLRGPAIDPDADLDSLAVYTSRLPNDAHRYRLIFVGNVPVQRQPPIIYVANHHLKPSK